jgi:hypothetical protein
MFRLSDLLTPENFAIGCLDAALVHLDLDIFPPYNGKLDLDVLQRAQNAMVIVHGANDNCRRSDALKTAAVSRIRDSIEGILAWTYAVVLRSAGRDRDVKLYGLMGDLLRTLWTLDPLLERAIFSSKHALSTLLLVWSCELKDMSRTKPANIRMEVLELMERFTSHPDGSDLLHNTILHRPSVRQHLYEGLNSRLAYLSTFRETEGSKWARKKRLLIMGIITDQLAELPGMHACLREAQYLDRWLKAVLACRTELEHDGILFASQTILRFANRAGRHSAEDVGLIASSGLIPLIGECFSSGWVVWDRETIPLAMNILSILRSSAYFPKALVPLSGAVNVVREDDPYPPRTAPTEASFAVHQLWKRMIALVRTIRGLMPGQDSETGKMGFSPRICDNEAVNLILPC